MFRGCRWLLMASQSLIFKFVTHTTLKMKRTIKFADYLWGISQGNVGFNDRHIPGYHYRTAVRTIKSIRNFLRRVIRELLDHSTYHCFIYKHSPCFFVIRHIFLIMTFKNCKRFSYVYATFGWFYFIILFITSHCID